VADAFPAAISRIQRAPAVDQSSQFAIQRLELVDARSNRSAFAIKKLEDVMTRRIAVGPHGQDALDLTQCEASLSGPTNEREPDQRTVVVVAVTVRPANGLRQQTPPLVEADRSGRQATTLGELPDQHFPKDIPLTFSCERRFTVRDMHVTLQYFDGCPNWAETERHLQRLADEHPELTISRHRVGTPDDADRLGFRGSPSVLVDGVDPFAAPDTPTAFACRVYQTPSGPAGSPTFEQLCAVLGYG
jgi:hypothetical protein